MLLEQVFFTLLFVAIYLFLFADKIAKKINKPWTRSVLTCFAVAFLIVGAALFIRQHFIPFDSPEEVYESVYGGEVDVVIEGVNSCYVIGNKGDKHFNRTENGWILPLFPITVAKKSKTIGTTMIQVFQYTFSEDYYVIVSETSSKSLILSDNRDSTFYQTYSKDTSNIQACGYCTYVHKINSEYVVTVNGMEVKLFE